MPFNIPWSKIVPRGAFEGTGGLFTLGWFEGDVVFDFPSGGFLGFATCFFGFSVPAVAANVESVEAFFVTFD